MTMHLEGPWLTTTRASRRSVKYTKAKLAQWQQDLVDVNRRNRQQGLPRLTLEQYIDQIHGRVKSAPRQFQPLVVKPDPHVERMREFRERYPSLDTLQGSTALPDKKVYTGTLIKGIATMHKSNAVPVIDEEQMKDISRMRRG